MKFESHFSKSALVKMLRGWGCTSIVLLLSALLFTSCENFLKSTEVAQEIRDSIAYNNAKSLRVRVIANEGTGSTIPSGEHQPKQGYKFEISFTENAGYSFLKWIAVDKDDATQIITNDVFFEDPTKLVTNVIITADSDRIRLLPLCAKRIAIDREPSPGYVANGVSRDRSIFVEFTKDLSAESFIFDESEIPAGAETKTDENGNIWSYTIDSKTYLKNISITNQDDYSIAEHFLQPQIDGKMLTVAVNKSKPIEFESGVLFKTVKVTLSGNIKDTEGITMNADKTWRYQITESTDDKAEVVLTSNATEGSVYLAGSKEYSIGQKIPLSFTENKDYQFVKWRYDKKYIHVDKENEADTYALVLDKTDGLNPTIIEAVCAERLRVAENGFSPVNTSAEPTVSKNSSIVITFTKDLPVDAEGISQLENITIAVGGSPVRNSFLSPVVNANTITFAADKTNMLDVPQGQTKTVSVTIPSDFYYQLEDGTKVTYGANGKSFDYKIDSTTLDKAEINFTAATGSGTITPAAGSANHYSIGQEVPLSFVPADGWKFNGWTITSGGTAVDETKIKIADKNALSTKLVVYDSLQGITVTANTSECLKIRSYSPSGNNNHKDSDIEITFNKPLAQECSNLLNRIRVSSDGNNFDSYYEARSLSDDRKTIILKNTSAISVPKGSVKNIIVTVPEELYYNDGNVKINLSEETFSFAVNYETTAKSNVTYKIINGETNQEFSSANAAGTHNHRDSEQYNIGEEVELSFDLNSGYQFYGWSITDSTGAVVTDSVSFKNSNSSDPQAVLIINKPAEELKINAVCYKRPVISTASVSPYDANTSNQVAKNTPIVLRFDHAIKPETKDEIIVSYSLSNFSKTTYYSTTISSDNKTITLKPIKMLPLNNSFETVTVTVPHEKIYYLASDGKTKITPADEDFTWSYRVNSSTVQKTSVRFATTEAAVSGRQITVGSTFLSSGTKQDMNEEQTLNLEFPAYTDYKFAGWKVDVGTTAGYTVNPSGYTTKGTITVTAGEKTFFTLTIDDSNAAQATAYSNEYIGSGTDGWGITISAKDVLLPKVTDHTGKGITSAIEKDSDIEITFNKPLAQECADLLNKISVSSDGYSIDSYYTNRTLSDDGTKITIKNTTQISIQKGSTKLITVTVPSDLYDAEANVNINEESFNFTVDYRTTEKTNLSFATDEADGNGKISVNGEEVSNGSNKELYVEESFNLEYPVSEGYAFAGWKVAVTGDYTVSTSSYVTNGSITVKNGNIPYFILVIDSDNPSKATAYSYDAIGSGITVSAKDFLIPTIASVKLNGTTDLFSVNSLNCYSSIHIIFNKEMSRSSLIFSDAGSGSLTITKNGFPGIHYDEYFTATWESNTELTISPKNTFKEFVRNENEQVSMTITFNANGKTIKDTGGHVLCQSLAVNNSLSINCLVSGSKENNPPVSDIHVYSTRDTEDYYYRELSDINFNSWSKTADLNYPFGHYSQNHVSSVYITVSGYDSESGLKEVQVTETYIRNKSNNSVIETSSTHSYSTDNLISTTTDEYGHKVNNYAIPYSFDSTNTKEDGLFKLEISLWDNDGNKTIKDYYVIKDTAYTLQLDKINIRAYFYESDKDKTIPVYNAQKNCYEIGFDFSMFCPPYDVFYYNCGTSRRMTLIMKEEGEVDRIIYDADIKNKSDIKDEINTAFNGIKRNADKNVILLMKIKKENGICEQLELPFDKWPYIAGINGTYNLDNEVRIAGGVGDDDQIRVLFSNTPTPTKDDLIDYVKNEVGKDPNKGENGIYYLFPLVITRLGDQGANCYGFWITRPLCLSKPFAYYKGIPEPANNDEIQFPIMTLPSADDISYKPNTGKATFSIGIEYPDNGYDYSQYRYVLKIDGNYFDDGDNINLLSGTEKNVCFVALDSEGNVCAKSQEQSLDLTNVDNQPPVVNIKICNHYAYKDIRDYTAIFKAWPGVTANYGPYDVDSKLDKVPFNNSVMDCYIVPYTYGRNVTKSDLLSGVFNKFSVSLSGTNNQYITIPYDGIDFGNYYIYFYVEDNSTLKNYSIDNYYYTLKYYITDYVPDVTFDDSTDEIQISAPTYTENLRRTDAFPRANTGSSDTNCIHANYVSIKVLENNSWTDSVGFIDNDTATSIARMQDKDGNYNYYRNTRQDSTWYYNVARSNYAGKFLQINVNFTASSWQYDGYGKYNFDIVQSQPYYVYTDYLRYKDTDTPIVCNNKNWIEGANGYQIFTDNPMFVHTMYCSRNLSEVLRLEKTNPTTEQYIREWESRAQETGIYTHTGSTNTTFTYGDDKIKDIPSGYYYTTIVHFADGTTLMSEVKQK